MCWLAALRIVRSAGNTEGDLYLLGESSGLTKMKEYTWLQDNAPLFELRHLAIQFLLISYFSIFLSWTIHTSINILQVPFWCFSNEYIIHLNYNNVYGKHESVTVWMIIIYYESIWMYYHTYTIVIEHLNKEVWAYHHAVPQFCNNDS